MLLLFHKNDYMYNDVLLAYHNYLKEVLIVSLKSNYNRILLVSLKNDVDIFKTSIK